MIVKLLNAKVVTFECEQTISKMGLNVITVKLFCISKSQFLKNLCIGTQCGGFQFSLILDL